LTCPNTDTDDSSQSVPVLFAPLFLESRHGGRVPAGLWARIVQRLLALNAAIWHNWLIGAPVERSLIAYDH
jgi:hypothetical protein